MSDCHPACTLGPNADHPGSDEYRCQDEHGHGLPFPGEDIVVGRVVGVVHVDWDDPRVIRTGPASFLLKPEPADPDQPEPGPLGDGWRDVGYVSGDATPFGDPGSG